jgi:hypothetical protein
MTKDRYIKRKENKQLSLDLYINKWGLTEYDFFIASPGYHYEDNTLYIVHKTKRTHDYCWDRHMRISSLSTLLKNMRRAKCVHLHESDTHLQKFDSIDELKHYLLIKKLAGI